MLLQPGGDVRFQMRPVENLTFSGNIPEPELLILDGQQQLTSLTQVLALNTPVKTFDEKGKQISRYYYINIDAALEDSRLEDAFIAVEEDRRIKTNFNRDIVLDLSTPQKECEAFYFPCNQILNSDAWEESLQEYTPEKFPQYMKFRKNVLNAFRSYQLPLIVLEKATTKEAVCLVFEKVNTGGVPLSVFELVTASFAADNFNLRDDWYGSNLRKKQGRVQRIQAEQILETVEPTDFLQAISILHTYEKRKADIKAGKTGKAASAVSAKRVSILSLSLEDYRQWADEVEKGFLLTAKFLRKECFFSSRDLPYRTQLVPLAAVLTTLKERWLEPRIYDKLCRWFWCGILGELYNGAVETRIANDLEELLPWLDSELADDAYDRINGLPRTISEASFQIGRLHTLRSRLSAAYKGLNILLLREGAEDFFWKATILELDIEEVAIDVHHIFPKKWCEERKIKPSSFNSILNKTPISYKANRMIGGKAPSIYLADIQNHKQVGLSDEKMNNTLKSHCIDPESLRSDNYELFLAKRKEQLIQILERAMGKTIERESRDYDSDVPEDDAQLQEDDAQLEDLV